MQQTKFLTVMACLDEKSQQVLSSLQNKLIQNGLAVNTSEVLFHVSLGSFPTSELNNVLQTMEQVSQLFEKFTLTLTYSYFNNRVLFLQPENSDKLLTLHKRFDCNYADGFPWHAHVTLLIGEEEQVCKAKSILGDLPEPIPVTVTSLLVGEFFPTKLIKSCPLK